MRIGFALALGLALAGCNRAPEVLTNRTDLQGELESVVVAPSAIGNAKTVEAAARAMCAGESFCWLLGYGSVAEMPPAGTMPAGGPPLFSYVKNTSTGLDRAIFDCRYFKGLGDDRCVATTADTEQRGSRAP